MMKKFIPKRNPIKALPNKTVFAKKTSPTRSIGYSSSFNFLNHKYNNNNNNNNFLTQHSLKRSFNTPKNVNKFQSMLKTTTPLPSVSAFAVKFNRPMPFLRNTAYFHSNTTRTGYQMLLNIPKPAASLIPKTALLRTSFAQKFFCTNNKEIQKQSDQNQTVPYGGTSSSVDQPDWSRVEAYQPEGSETTVTDAYRMSEALKFRSTKTGLGIGVYAINPETGKKEKRTTGLVGLGVRPRGRFELMDLYYKNLEKIQKDFPQDYALRQILEASYRWRLEVLETTEDHEEIEEKLASGQIEEMIWAAENDWEALELVAEKKLWEPQEKYHAVPFIWKPTSTPETHYSKDHGRYEAPPAER